MQPESKQEIHWLRVEDPESDTFLGEIAGSTAEHVEAALARGFTACRKARMPAHRRSRVLADAAARVHEDAEAFACLIASEGIKTIREARAEVARCVTTLQLSAEEARRIGGEVIPMDQVPAGLGKLGFTTRVPAGLIVAITPFNDPLNLVAHKIGPAVAVGAPIILKPHEKTPLSAIKLHKVLLDAGLPDDLVQLVQGGAEVGMHLVEDSRPRVVSFTGGRRTGRIIAQQAGFKKLILELGGVAIVMVAADADLDAAAAAIHSAAFSAAGQNCLHAQRIIVDRRVADPLRHRLVQRAKAMNLGPKLDERTDMGCCIDEAAARRIDDLIRRSIDAGADLLTGGIVEGTRVAPTWLMSSTLHDLLASEEVFGPVALLEIAEDFAEGLMRLNAAGDALHVSVFTASLERALAVYDIAHAAAVLVNESTDFRLDAMPFGGSGQAGLEREGVRHAIEALSESKMLIIQRPLKIAS